MYKNTGVCRLYTLHKNKPFLLVIFRFAYQTAKVHNVGIEQRQPPRRQGAEKWRRTNMLNDLLQELKKALQNGDKKEVNRIVRALNQLGMDNTTIKILLKEI